MRSYFLIDGMMIYDVMRAQKLMHALTPAGARRSSKAKPIDWSAPC